MDKARAEPKIKSKTNIISELDIVVDVVCVITWFQWLADMYCNIERMME